MLTPNAPGGAGRANQPGGSDLVPWAYRPWRKKCGDCLIFPFCLSPEKRSNEHTTEVENMKSLVHRLFTALHLEEIHKKREHHLLEKIDHLKGQLQPLEQVRKHHS